MIDDSKCANEDRPSWGWRCTGCDAVQPELTPGDALPDPSWRWTGGAWQHKCPDNHPQHGHTYCEPFGLDALHANFVRHRETLEWMHDRINRGRITWHQLWVELKVRHPELFKGEGPL